MTKDKKDNQVVLFLRSLLFSIVMITSTVIHPTLCVLIFPLPYRWRYRFSIQWARFVIWALKVICKIDYQLVGKENIPKENIILFSNHQSAWETLAFQVFFPMQTWVIKRELLWIPFMGWALAALNPVAINRKAGRAAMEQIIKQGKERLAQGNWIVIFPEGTRIPVGHTRKFARGGATLAAATGAPVLPVAHNAGMFWPRRGFIKTPGTITVKIGPIIETKNRNAEEINRLAKQNSKYQQQYLVLHTKHINDP